MLVSLRLLIEKQLKELQKMLNISMQNKHDEEDNLGMLLLHLNHIKKLMQMMATASKGGAAKHLAAIDSAAHTVLKALERECPSSLDTQLRALSLSARPIAPATSIARDRGGFLPPFR